MRCATFVYADWRTPIATLVGAAIGFSALPSSAAGQTTSQPMLASPSGSEPGSQRDMMPETDRDPSPVSSLTLTAGGAAWSGNFGAATTTTIASGIIGARYQRGGLRLSAVLPYMRIESDGSFFAGLGGTPLFVAPQVRPPRRVREGLADLTLGASYLLPASATGGIDIDVTGRIKVPTASDSSGLSTGKVDYSAGVDVSKSFGRLTPSTSVTYRVFGNNAIWQFRNGVDVTAGASYTVGRATALVLTYEFAQAASRYIGDSHELLLGASTPLARRLRLTGYVSKGLSNGAADVSGGASIAVRF